LFIFGRDSAPLEAELVPNTAMDRPARRAAGGSKSSESKALDVLLTAWPGPAARLAADGTVIEANAAAAALLDEFRARAGAGGFATLIAAAAADGQARTDTIVVPTEPTPVTFDFSLVALPGGEVMLLGRDVSLAANLRQALADSRLRFKDLVEISSDFAWETDAAGSFTFVSPRGALGWKATDLLGRPASSLIDDTVPMGDGPSPFTTRRPVDQIELWLRRADGTAACVAISAVPLRGEGVTGGARGVWRDVSESHAREAALAEAENRERLVGYITRTIRDEVEPEAMLGTAASATANGLGTSGCRIWDADREGILSAAADYGARSPEALNIEQHMAAHVRRLAAGTDAPRPDRDDQIEIGTADGRFLGAVTRFHRRINGAIGLWRAGDAADWSDSDRAVMAKLADQLGIAQEQIANHEALARQARTDALTGLLNRRGFTKRLDRQIAACAASGKPGTLVYVDLDNFKAVNDRLGHPAGDAALKGLAAALRGAVRSGDLVARLGGDEFAMWLSDTDHPAAVERAKQILALTAEIAPYSAGPDKPLGLSVGVAVHLPGHQENTAELLERADQAMYAVKHCGKGSYSVAPDVEAFRAAKGGSPS
jgi:diguanylate cyclase (GGDEF)-like protein/PAS domain S-box-containing protein